MENDYIPSDAMARAVGLHPNHAKLPRFVALGSKKPAPLALCEVLTLIWIPRDLLDCLRLLG